MSILVHVKDRAGIESEIDALDGCALMDSLRDGRTGVEGTCGGMMSCGTCHVYVDPEWIARLPARSEDEEAMLVALGELVELRAGSRLSCQIQMNAGLVGLKVVVAPAF